MRIVSIYTLVALLCMAGTALASDLTILRTDTGAWPTVRVVVESTDIGSPEEAFSLALPSERPVTASRVKELLDQPQPASMVIALDTSRSLSPEHLKAAQESLARFVDRLQDSDQLSLLSFNDTVQLVTGFTSDREAFKRTLSNLSLGGMNTELYRAMLYGIENLKNIPGQRTLMVITDGKDEGTAVSLEDVVQAARNNGIRVMIVGLPVLRDNESETYLPLMRSIAQETGGMYRTAASAEELGRATYELLVENQGLATHVYEATFDLDGTTLPVSDSAQVQATFSRQGSNGLDEAFVILSLPENAAFASNTMRRSSRDTRVADTAQMASRQRVSEGAIADTAQMPMQNRAYGTQVTDTGNTQVSTLAATTASADRMEHKLNTRLVANSERQDRAVTTSNAAVAEDNIHTRVSRVWPWIVGLLLLLGLLWIYKKRQTATDGVPLIIEFPETGKRFPLKAGTMVLGSGKNSDIRIDGPDISEAHVEFCTGRACEVKNLAGSRGVLINGKMVEQNTKLKAGDVLVIGSTRALISRADGKK